VLEARPDIEDIVLQALRGGTYGDTGIPNLEYYRNNDNQTELVNKFNESRLGRFLQHGESDDLHLPPVDQELPLVSHFERTRSETGFGTNNCAPAQSSAVPIHPNQRSRRMSSSSGANSVITNPHGAPQNPGDIYLQSEDIRRRVFDPLQDQRRGYGGPGYQVSPALQNTGFESNNPVNHYHGYNKAHVPNAETSSNVNDFSSTPSAPQTSFQGDNRSDPNLDVSDTHPSRWLVDSVFPFNMTSWC
jgi:hypothetical protein